MSCWEVLGIEPTADSKVIKRAYAKKLKQLAIDEQIEEFQQLKKAFDHALKQAEWRQKQTDLGLEIADQADTVSAALPIEAFHADSTTNEATELEVVGASIREFLASQTYFDDFETWYELLYSVSQLAITEFDSIVPLILEVLEEKILYLDKKIVDFLFSFLPMETTSLGNDGRTIKALRARASRLPDCSFAMWSVLAKEDRELYFYKRWQFYNRLGSEYPNLELAVDIQQEYEELLDFGAQDSEVYGWRALMSLIEVKGQVNNFISEKYVAYLGYLDAGLQQPYGRKALIQYLVLYNECWENETVTPQLRQQFAYAQQALPQLWCTFLLGTLAFRAGKYEQAFAKWEEEPYLRVKYLSFFAKQYHRLTGQTYQGTTRIIEEQATYQPIPQPQAKKPSVRIWLSTIIFIILSIVKLTMYMPQATTKPDVSEWLKEHPIQQKFPKKNTESPLTRHINLGNLFADAFLVTSTEETKKKLIASFVAQNQKSVFLNHLEDEALWNEATAANLSYTYKYYSGSDSWREIIYSNQQPLYILRYDNQLNIKEVKGPGWTELPEDVFMEEVREIECQPYNSSVAFVSEFLQTDLSVQAFLDQYGHYLAEPLQEQLLQIGELPQVNVEDYQFISYFYDEDFYLVVGSSPENIELLLTFDETGRILHIYGKQFEQLPEPEWQALLQKFSESEPLDNTTWEGINEQSLLVEWQDSL